MDLRGKRIVGAALVSARDDAPSSAVESLEKALAAAGACVVGRLVQRRGVSRDKRPGGAQRMDRPISSATLIGKGKASELAALCGEVSADLVVFQNRLSSTQRSNLRELCGVQVVDSLES